MAVRIYIAGAIALLGLAAFAYVETSGRPAPKLELTPEAKAYARSLELSDVTMKATGNYMTQTVVEIEGKIANKGPRPVEIVEIYCQFYDTYGLLVLRERVPIVSSKMGGLKPGEMKPFRLPFDEIPASWNQASPQLVIAAVKFS